MRTAACPPPRRSPRPRGFLPALAPAAALAAALAAGPAGLPGAAQAAEVDVLEVEQVARFPRLASGEAKSGEVERFQRLLIDRAGGRVRLEEFAREGDKYPAVVHILRPDPEGAGVVIWEFPEGMPEGRKPYRERKGDLNDRQKERRRAEEEMIRRLQTRPAAERKAALARLHLRPDGSRQVHVERSDAPARLGRPCRRVVVTENGRTIIDADVAEQKAPEAGGGERASSYFELYRRLGVFSDEVLEKLRDVEGVPLRAEITVVTELTTLATYVLKIEVRKLAERKVAGEFFELAEGAELIPEVPPISKCFICGTQFETQRGGPPFITPEGTVYVCGERCWTTLQKKFRVPSPRPPR